MKIETDSYYVPVNGVLVIVDHDDYHWAMEKTWRLRSDGYICRNPTWKGATLLMHREIMLKARMGLPLERGFVVDHINGNKLDNRRSNLRYCKQSENSRNRDKAKSNKSGYKGVDYDKNYKRWRARIKKDYKEIIIGYFDSKEDAAHAYNSAALKYFGEFAKLNEVK